MSTERLDLFPGPTEPELAVVHGLLDAFSADSKGGEAFRLKPERLKVLPSFRAICFLAGKDNER